MRFCPENLNGTAEPVFVNMHTAPGT